MISVVIGIYNGEKYLSDCIDSVLAQTFEEVQIVLVDDKSSDRSLCIAQEYASRHPGKIKLIAQEENRGAGNTWNTGIQAADGEYVLTYVKKSMPPRDMESRTLCLQGNGDGLKSAASCTSRSRKGA